MKMKKLLVLLICGWMFAACSNNDTPNETPTDEVEAQLQKMTLREKVGQMFYIRIESLDPSIEWTKYDDLANLKNQEITMKMRKTNEQYPVGGIILYAWNIEDETQLASIISQVRSLKGNPLLCIDEEGGRVSRLANNPNFDVKKYESMAAIGATGDPKNAYECGNTIGTYLKYYGFDIDFAPVADVNTNPDNIIIGPRAFSDKPEVAAPMVTSYLQGLKDAGITGCVKHFPGHGDTSDDTHTGYVQSLKTWEEMKDCEMVTFRTGIQWGCQLIMTAHIAVPNVTGSTIPSTMSSVVLQDKLRGELGYQNIIITDGMEMGAITKHYTSGEAAVGSIKAGVDIVLGPRDFTEAFDAVIAAVNDGSISEERINQSVRRILKLKLQRKH
jgi:beta-N-acetylhexosaminidase